MPSAKASSSKVGRPKTKEEASSSGSSDTEAEAEEVEAAASGAINRFKLGPNNLPFYPNEQERIEPHKMLEIVQISTVVAEENDKAKRQRQFMAVKDFHMWHRIHVLPANSKSYYSPGHVRREFKRYVLTARRSADLPVSAVLTMMDAYLSTPAVLALYTDLPKPPVRTIKGLFTSNWFKKHGHENDTMIASQRLAMTVWNAMDLEAKEKLGKKLAKLRKKYRAGLDAFFELHAELPDSFKPFLLQQLDRLEKTRPAAAAPTAVRAKPQPPPPQKSAFDMYADSKRHKYAELSDEEAEAKLRRHFDKLDGERKAKYEQMALAHNKPQPKRRRPPSASPSKQRASSPVAPQLPDSSTHADVDARHSPPPPPPPPPKKKKKRRETTENTNHAAPVEAEDWNTFVNEIAFE